MAFNVKRYLIKVQGGRYYLPVAARLVWFREEHPEWRIETEPLEIDAERGIAIFRARVLDEQGNVLATGTKMETREGFADFIEKAETGAIGRALAVAGFGTQFAPELSEGGVVHPVDAPRIATAARCAPTARRSIPHLLSPGGKTAMRHGQGRPCRIACRVVILNLYLSPLQLRFWLLRLIRA
jgi:hypothetical protein